jgi:hypothetical protein
MSKKSSEHRKRNSTCSSDESGGSTKSPDVTCSSTTNTGETNGCSSDGSVNSTKVCAIQSSTTTNNCQEVDGLCNGYSSKNILLSIDVDKKKNAVIYIVVLLVAKVMLVGITVWLGGTANAASSNVLPFAQDSTLHIATNAVCPSLGLEESITEEDSSNPSLEASRSMHDEAVRRNNFELHNLWYHFGNHQQNIESTTITATTDNKHHHHFQQAVKRFIAQFFHKNKRRNSTTSSNKQNQSSGTVSTDALFTSTQHQKDLIQELGKRVRQRAQQQEYINELCKDFNSRVAAISWGGIAPYKGTTSAVRMWWATSDDISKDGYEILFSYLDTMKWPEDLHITSSISSKTFCSHHPNSCPVGKL